MNTKVFLILMLGLCATAQAVTKIDPTLDILSNGTSKAAIAGISKSLNITKSTTGERRVDCLVRASDVVAVRAFINANGGTVRTVVSDVMTAWVPVSLISDLDAMPEVIYVEASKRLGSKMGDSNSVLSDGGPDFTTNPGNARVVTTANNVQDGTGSGLGGISYNGSGVIVGVVDSGIDCTNADFNVSASDSTTRMITYWDQTINGSGVQEIIGSGGVEYTTAQIQSGTTCEEDSPDTDGHGTHVTGIAASSNATYTGMAPASSIIMVKAPLSAALDGGTFSSYVIDAVNYIFRKAQSLKRPAVVNLSLGTSFGAHDDTSNLEIALNGFLSNVQGRAIVNAAGNENYPSSLSTASTYGGLHALISATSGSPVAYEFKILSALDSYSVGGTQADIWLESGGTCSVTLNAFSGTQKTSATVQVLSVSPGNQSSATDGNIVVTVNFTDSANANNGKQQAVVTIAAASSSKASFLDNYTYDLIFSGTCSGHAWLYFDSTSINDFTKDLNGTTNATYGYTYVAGDSNYTTTIPATASSVIAAGSFMGRAFWTNLLGNTVDNTSMSPACGTGVGGTMSDISLFSSLGPTADGRTKPDISAPGEPVLSTMSSSVASGLSSACKADATHMYDAGTSMSSPAVAGIVALMLQRNGCLTPSEIKTLLTDNPTTDSFTGTTGLPTDVWGYGKINAVAAVAATTAATCIPDNTNEDGAGTATDDTTPSSTGSGCSLIRTK